MSSPGQRPRGRLVVISGPSGVGKTTVAARLTESADFQRVITATTRPPRDGEQDGIDYHFLDLETFEDGIRQNRFLEHAVVHGKHRYGTPRQEVVRGIEAGKALVLAIDVQGVRTLRRNAPELPVVSIFLLPPSREELVRRLEARGSEDAAEIRARLETADGELESEADYDHRVINENVEDAVRKIRALAGR